ncbi:MAG TPA: DUF4340 domain-containing protein [Opitutaceae bacterium]|nr:DUF4340 domain-containing protein [Opitutaceae bacterium]
MKLKNLALAVAVLAVLSVITFFVQRPAPPPSADPRVGQPLAAAATLGQAAKVRIADLGKTVLLVKSADGTWRVPGYYDLPADFSKLSHLVGDLTEARLQRLVTTNPERIGRLEFKDTQIAFLDSADKELWSVTLGRNAENGGRFVRFGSEQKAYLANLNTDVDVEAKNWADSQLLNLKPDDIAKMEVSFPDDGGQTVTVSRAKKEDPFVSDKTPEGQRLKGEAVANLLSSVTTLRFSDSSDPADPNAVAARTHNRVVKLTTFAGQTFTIGIGRKPEEKVIKAPAPAGDASKSGPAAVLSALQGDKKDAAAPDAAKPGEGPAKTLEPATETVPAGPVYFSIASSDAGAPINALMQKRAFQTGEYAFTSLPQKVDDLFEPAPAPAPAPATTATPAPASKAP